jgi:hypothetical protein
MTAVLPDAIRRKLGTDATMARWRDRAFDWSTGAHCVAMLRFHLRQMGHHPPTLPRIRSALAARREMKARGWESVADLLDALPTLVRIPPARMILGDVVVGPADEGFGAVGIHTGGDKLLGWAEDEPKASVLIVDVGQLQGAWRV